MHQSFIVNNELFLLRVRHLKIREKRIKPPLHKSLLTNGAILHILQTVGDTWGKCSHLKKSAWDMSQAVPPSLPPVQLWLHGNQALQGMIHFQCCDNIKGWSIVFPKHYKRIRADQVVLIYLFGRFKEFINKLYCQLLQFPLIRHLAAWTLKVPTMS